MVGTCRTTSPGWFRPPVSSWPSSQLTQSCPSQASQISGDHEVDADPADRAVDPQQHRAGRDRGGQADQQGVVRSWWIEERLHLVALHQFLPVIDRFPVGAIGHQLGQAAGHDGQRSGRAERDRFVKVCSGGGNFGLRPDQHLGRLRGGQPERRRSPRGDSWKQLQTDKFQKLGVVPVRNPVQSVDELVHHLRECLDQGDARIADIVIGPLRHAALYEAFGVVDQRLEVAIVQIGCGKGHQCPPDSTAGTAGSCCGMT